VFWAACESVSAGGLVGEVVWLGFSGLGALFGFVWWIGN